MNKKTPQKTK